MGANAVGKRPARANATELIFIALLHAGAGHGHEPAGGKRYPNTFAGAFEYEVGKEFGIGKEHHDTIHERGGRMQHWWHIFTNVLNPVIFPVWLINKWRLARRKAREMRKLGHMEHIFNTLSAKHPIRDVPSSIAKGLEQSAFYDHSKGDTFSNALTVMEKQGRLNIGLQMRLSEEIAKTSDAAKKASLGGRLLHVRALEDLMNQRRAIIDEYAEVGDKMLKELTKHGVVGHDLLEREEKLRHSAQQMGEAMEGFSKQFRAMEDEYLNPPKK